MNWYRIAILGGLLTMASCGLFGGKDEGDQEAESVTAPKLVGRIASINEKQRFVLIETYGEWVLGEDLLLSSFGGQNERSATLVISGEKMGRFAAADWKSGEVKFGDQVYARPMVEKSTPTEIEILSETGVESSDSGANFEKMTPGTD